LTELNNVLDARAEFAARALITKMERILEKHGDLDRYDVYCEWYEDDATEDDIEIWLRDRNDDSRVGPLDLKTMMGK
jgi:hypothetical protein